MQRHPVLARSNPCTKSCTASKAPTKSIQYRGNSKSPNRKKSEQRSFLLIKSSSECKSGSESNDVSLSFHDGMLALRKPSRSGGGSSVAGRGRGRERWQRDWAIDWAEWTQHSLARHKSLNSIDHGEVPARLQWALTASPARQTGPTWLPNRKLWLTCDLFFTGFQVCNPIVPLWEFYPCAQHAFVHKAIKLLKIYVKYVYLNIRWTFVKH